MYRLQFTQHNWNMPGLFDRPSIYSKTQNSWLWKIEDNLLLTKSQKNCWLNFLAFQEFVAWNHTSILFPKLTVFIQTRRSLTSFRISYRYFLPAHFCPPVARFLNTINTNHPMSVPKRKTDLFCFLAMVNALSPCNLSSKILTSRTEKSPIVLGG